MGGYILTMNLVPGVSSLRRYSEDGSVTWFSEKTNVAYLVCNRSSPD